MVMRGKFWSKLLRMPKNCLLQIVSRKSLSTNLLSNRMQTPLMQVATRKSSVMCYTIVTSVWVVVITVVSTMHVMNNGAGNTVFDKMMLVTTKEGMKLSCYNLGTILRDSCDWISTYRYLDCRLGTYV